MLLYKLIYDCKGLASSEKIQRRFVFTFAHVIANKVFVTRSICNSAAPSAPPAGRDSYSVCVQLLSGFTCPAVIMTGEGKTRLCGLYTTIRNLQ